MKKLLFLGLIASTLVFTNCGKDDDPDPLMNQLKLSATNYDVNNGYLVEFPKTEDIFYYWTLVLTDGDYDSYTGSTNAANTNYALVVSLASRSADVSGEYVYVAPGVSTTEEKIFAGIMFTDLNNVQGVSLTEGTINISGSGGNYTLEANGMAGTLTFEGHYDGTFTVDPGAYNESIVNNGTSDLISDMNSGSIWVEAGAQKVNGSTSTSFTAIFTDDSQFDISSECVQSPYVEIRLIPDGGSLVSGEYVFSNMREDGTASVGIIDFARGGQNDNSWNADFVSGSVTVLDAGNDRYIFTWTFDAFVSSNGRLMGGTPNGTASGDFKGLYNVTTSFGCL